MDTNWQVTETVAALATAPGPAGVAVVRVSGPEAWTVAARVVRLPAPADWNDAVGRRLHARVVRPGGEEALDDAIVLVFRAPHSYTGEDVVELQGHGGTVPSRRLLDAVLDAGARLAPPGEFTRRAFLNGRMDLTQAEAVLDLIQARTERAAQAARAQLDGELGGEVGAIYTALTDLAADLEALLDFDEGELPPGFTAEAAARLDALAGRVQALLATWRVGHLLRDGALTVISGRPNVGKSSLLNVLLGRPRAIVSPRPGTTRDSIEESLDLNGAPLRLVDTAGLREAAGVVEAEGVSRAAGLAAQADLNVHVLDASRPLGASDRAHLARLDPARTVLVLNKCDRPRRIEPGELRGWRAVWVCARDGRGVDELRGALSERLGLAAEGPLHADVSARHRDELVRTAERLAAARGRLADGPIGLVPAATELREAAAALGRIIGRDCSEDLLDSIFSRFCVGK